eukprot:jgi/Mesen1/6756/ME000344S06040
MALRMSCISRIKALSLRLHNASGGRNASCAIVNQRFIAKQTKLICVQAVTRKFIQQTLLCRDMLESSSVAAVEAERRGESVEQGHLFTSRELERIPWQPGVVHPEELQGVLNQKSWAKEEVVRAAQGACQHSCPHHGVEEAGQVEDGHRDGCARTAVYERLESPVSVLTVSGGSRKRCHSHFSDDEADDDEHEPQEQLDEEESAGSNCEYCEAATAAEGRASVEDSTAGASGDASPEGQGQLEVQNLYPAYATQARSHLSQTSCSHVSSSKRQRTDGAHVAAQMPSSPVAESPSAAAAAGAGSGAGVASAPGRPAYSLGQSAAMRLQRVLARWHWDLKLGREDTAALAFHLFRRLLIKVQPSLVGTEALRVCLAACLWTAAKLEESQTDVPKAADVSAATGISERQLLAAEKNLLVALDWRLLEGWVRRVE